MYSCCGSILVPCYGCHKQPPPLLATTVTTSQPQIEPLDSVYHQHRHHQTCSTTVSLLTTTTSARRSAGVGVTRRRLYALTAMASGMVLILVYTVSFSCCVLVHSGLVGRADPDEVVYQQDLEHNMSPSSSGSSLYYGTGGGGGARPVHLPVVSQHPDNEPYELDSSSQERPIQSSSSRRHHHPVSTSLRAGNKNLPDAIIIGVKKAGTRALLEFLRVHPDVRAPGPEPHFFDRNYDLGFDWYRSQMPSTIEGQLTIEKTPSYFVTKEVPGRIYDMNRNTKLILVVRNPVTRAISDYAQALAKRPDTKSFEEMAFIDNSTGLVDTSWGAIKIGVYARHLERWLKYFPLSQIHFVNGEKLISSPANEMGKVQDFLGLKRVITDKHFFFNTTKGFPCLKKPENSGNPHCLGKTKGRPHPEVSPQVLKRLSDFFRPFNQKFYQMTNHDFGWL